MAWSQAATARLTARQAAAQAQAPRVVAERGSDTFDLLDLRF